MFQRFNGRAGHWGLLLLASASLFLVNLGRPSLWDIDEGNNAECAREMLESGDWRTPTCNYQPRHDKPALVYWLQIAAYQALGVKESAARLPSALAALLAVLVVYELGRRMFGATSGLLAGLALASSPLFCASAHFANPDALLNLFTALALAIFWLGFALGRRWWFVPAGVSSGLAVLAKGPVGLVLPCATVLLFLLWSRRLGLLWDRRLLAGALAFGLTAVPWYAWVAVETRAEFLEGFFLTHNVGRYLSPMENHRGPFFYYLVVLVLGCAPWSAFFGPAAWDGIKSYRERESPADARLAIRFLVCWAVVYLVFFSVSRTKLPNYVLPAFTPVALLTARFLDRWARGAVHPPAWSTGLSLACLALVGGAAAAGFLLAGGVVEASFLRGRRLPGLEGWAAAGLIPVLGAAAAGWCLRRGNRVGGVAAFAAAAVLFVGVLAAGAGAALNAHTAPRPLARLIERHQAGRDIRVACYAYFQPSLVFYCRREVERLTSEAEVLEVLRCPTPVYLCMPEQVWRGLEGKASVPCRALGRHRDFYRNCDVVVVTNR